MKGARPASSIVFGVKVRGHGDGAGHDGAAYLTADADHVAGCNRQEVRRHWRRRLEAGPTQAVVYVQRERCWHVGQHQHVPGSLNIYRHDVSKGWMTPIRHSFETQGKPLRSWLRMTQV